MTASSYKYKTFVNREELSDVLKSHHHSSPSSPSSAAALYSHTSSRSSNSNCVGAGCPRKYVYTYYLNALIESEQDEGVYQCINPDSPDLVLRNVTVLIASKSVIFVFPTHI